MLRHVKRWSLTVVGIGAVGAVAVYGLVSPGTATSAVVNTSAPLALALLVAGAGVGIGRMHDADFVASVALWAVVSATMGVAINQWYVFLLDGAFPEQAFEFTISSVSLTAAFGTATGYYYTALRRNANELERTNRLLRDRNRRLDEFASIVSHDLRNPLNVAQGQLDLARETEGEEKEERFGKVERAHGRMERLITEVLSFSRRGDEVYEPERVRLSEVAEEAVVGTPMSEASVELRTDTAVRGDRDRLGTVFENLFRNAVEHGPGRSDGDGCETEVEVGADDDCVFYVEDNGPGIPPDERERVFEGGYSTKDGGSGFGLSTVRRTAEVHGWSVRVTDGDGGGARFAFVDED
jgi:signal transduction histidine kinase